MSDNTIFTLLGIGGVLFHSFIKMNTLAKDARIANIRFDPWKDYVKTDIFGILASFISVGIWLLLFGEVATKYKAIEAFPRVSFFVMGALGSWGLQLLLSVAKRKIRSVVDTKTNIADNKTGDV